MRYRYNARRVSKLRASMLLHVSARARELRCGHVRLAWLNGMRALCAVRRASGAAAMNAQRVNNSMPPA